MKWSLSNMLLNYRSEITFTRPLKFSPTSPNGETNRLSLQRFSPDVIVSYRATGAHHTGFPRGPHDLRVVLQQTTLLLRTGTGTLIGTASVPHLLAPSLCLGGQTSYSLNFDLRSQKETTKHKRLRSLESEDFRGPWWRVKPLLKKTGRHRVYVSL